MIELGSNLVAVGGKWYRHVVWDWNGTLLDDLVVAMEVVNRVLVRFGAEPVGVQRYQEYFDYPAIEFYRRAGVDLERWRYEEVAGVFYEEFEKDWRRCSLHRGVREVLTKVNAAGVDQSLLTASPQDVIDASIEYYGLTGQFVEVVGQDNRLSGGKTERGRELMAELGGAGDEVLVIGDTAHDYEVARAMGADCVLLSCGHHGREKLSRCGVAVFDSLAEVFA